MGNDKKTISDQSAVFLFFVCLEFIVPSRIFHSYGDVTIARHSWSLSSEGSLTCHIHCDMSLPFIMVIFEDAWHSHLLPSVCQWSSHYLFLRLRSVATGDRTPISRMPGGRSTPTPPRRSKALYIHVKVIYLYPVWHNWFRYNIYCICDITLKLIKKKYYINSYYICALTWKQIPKCYKTF